MHQRHAAWCAWLATAMLCIPLFLPAQEPLVPYRKGKLWGYAQPETGAVIVPPTLDSAGFFERGYQTTYPVAWVKKGGRFGLVNRRGELVLPIQEATAWPITQVAPGFFAVERLTRDRFSEYEAYSAYQLATGFTFWPLSYFDGDGRLVGKPFEWLTVRNLTYDHGYTMCDDANCFSPRTYPDFALKNTYQFVYRDGQVGIFDLTKGQLAIAPQWTRLSSQGQVIIAQRWETTRSSTGNVFQTVLIDLLSGSKKAVPDSMEVLISKGFGDLILARSKTSHLLGFLNKKAQLVIPLQFFTANPFSENGLTKVQSVAGTWSVIDQTGRAKYRLGKYNGFTRLPDGSIWTQSDEDGLYRNRGLAPADSAAQPGLDYPPQPLQIGTSSFLLERVSKLAGLVNPTGQTVLPFEFDNINTALSSGGLAQDSALRQLFFAVTKNNRQWVFDRRTMQPVWPPLLPGNGLTLGKTFDQSNFELLPPISGDSLFVIRLADKRIDMLNIRSGQRWGVTNVREFYIAPPQTDVCFPRLASRMRR